MESLRNRTYKLTVSHPPILFILQSKPRKSRPLLYFDTKTNTNRSLRYAVNQKSPFMDEQDGNAILEPVVFENGMLNVPATNPVLQQFLHYHPDNGVKFVELDVAKDAREEFDRISAEGEALVKVRSLELSDFIQVARAGLNRDTTKMSSDEIKRDVAVFAKNNPKEFLRLLEDPLFRMQDFVARCFEQKLFIVKNKGRDIYFNLPQNKSKFLVIPFGENRYFSIAKYLQSDEGLSAYKLLKDIVQEESI